MLHTLLEIPGPSLTNPRISPTKVAIKQLLYQDQISTNVETEIKKAVIKHQLKFQQHDLR